MSDLLAKVIILKYRGVKYYDRSVKVSPQEQYLAVKYREITYQKKKQFAPVRKKSVCLKYRSNSYEHSKPITNSETIDRLNLSLTAY